MTTIIEYDFDKICRSCLCTSDNLKSIFETNVNFGDKQSNGTRISCRRTRRSNLDMQKDELQLTVNEVIVACAKVQISCDDGLPQSICDQCITDVQNAFVYKKTCEKSDLKLREYLKTKKIKKEETAKAIDIKHENDDSSDNENDAEYNPTEDGDDITASGGKNDPLFEYLTMNELKPDLCEIKMAKEDDDVDETDATVINNSNTIVPSTEDSDDETLLKKAKLVNGRYVCPICSRSLADRSTLTLHLRLHTGKKLKHCSLCQRGFSKQSHLNRHMNSHNKKTYTCDYCDETFDTYQARRIHATTEHWGKKKTAESGSSKRKKDTPAVAKDIKEIHQIDTSTPHKKCVCNICENSFEKILDLRKHLHWHANEDKSLTELNLLPKQTEILNIMAADLHIDSKDITGETLQLLIKSKIENKLDMSLFYQITNELGWELSISDSETDTEAESLESSTRKPYDCSKCRKSFGRLHKIMHHMETDHSESIPMDFANFKCKHCEQYFPNEQVLSKHVRLQCGNTMKKFICSICNYRFMWRNNLDEHTQKVHTVKTNEFETDEVVSPHKPSDTRTREKTFTCEICMKAFYRHEHLDRHRKIHSPAEKRFCCDICEKKFNRKDNLKSHMRIHRPEAEKDNVNKHLCVYCGKSFSNSSNLIVHMRRHTGEKPYKCDMCDKGFPRSSDLQCHRRTHTGEKPCLCTICGKGFSRSNKLVRHMRIHTGVRPYKCTYCDRAFTQSNDLTLHIRRHTGDKPYVCGICGDRFIQGTALAQHRRAQGHFEETSNTAPFSSISVNNPNRFTNANRVNRIGLIPPTTTETSTTITKSRTSVTTATITTDATPMKPVMSLSITSNGIITQSHTSNDFSVNDMGSTIPPSSLISPFIISQAPTSANYLTASRFLAAPVLSQSVSSSSVNTSPQSELATLFSLSYNPGY